MSNETIVQKVLENAPRYGVVEIHFVNGKIVFSKTTTSTKYESEETLSRVRRYSR